MKDDNLFAQMSANVRSKHDRLVKDVAGDDDSDKKVLTQVQMSQAQKERFAGFAKTYGMSLSAFVRMACEEYIRTHS